MCSAKARHGKAILTCCRRDGTTGGTPWVEGETPLVHGELRRCIDEAIVRQERRLKLGAQQ